MTHLDFEQLNDLIDGRVAAGERVVLEGHLAICTECAAARRRLAELLARAAELPTEIDPPAGVWTSIRDRIGPSRRSANSWPWQLAAAVLLIALTATITTRLVRRPIVVVRQPAPVVSAAATLAGPARVVDADYAAIVHELTEGLAMRRHQLRPETVAKVEASLRVIDTALNEARAALADDPANRNLLDLLAATYEQKIDLLRRANELPSTI